jgi:hypothetical protein
MLFAYLGPDTMLPLTSAFAAVLGVALMFGRQVLRAGWVAVGGIRRLIGSTSHQPEVAGQRADRAHIGTAHPTIERKRRTAVSTDRVES